jgi:hypothetical protein
MKTLLATLILAAALAAAPAAGQTVKSLGYNTTNGQIVYSGTNALTFTNSLTVASQTGSVLSVGTTNVQIRRDPGSGSLIFTANGNTNTFEFLTSGRLRLSGPLSFDATTNALGHAAATRTNLSLGATWLTNTDVTNFRTDIGVGASNAPVFLGARLSDSLIINGTNAQLIAGPNVSVRLDGASGLQFLGTNASTLSAATRTNLGLPLPALTNTSNADFRTAIGLGSAATNDANAFQPASANLTNLASNNAANLTNFPALLLRTNGSAAGLTNFPTLNQNTTGTASNVTGAVAIANGGTGATNASNARTALGLGETNNVTFSNVTSTGTLIIASPTVPAATNSTGVKGQIAFTNNFLYICVASNTWRRIQLGTWE